MRTIKHDAGFEWQADVMGNPASDATGDFRPAYWIGLTANTDSPLTGDTVLTGEVGAGSLVRAAGTFSYTPGQNFFTVSHLFTSDQTITIHKWAVFTAATGGIMVASDFLDAPAPLRSGDQTLITVPVTL